MEKSNTDWYVSILIMRVELYNENKDNMKRKCTIYENVHLIQASNSKEAYKKSVKLGKESETNEFINEKNVIGRLIFEGINGLFPVYEPIDDECEILWTTHYCSVKTSKKLIKDKAFWLSN